jgi:hypothetical protein
MMHALLGARFAGLSAIGGRETTQELDMTLADRLIDLNRWYEGLPEGRRIFVYPAVLVAAGFVNTRLTGAPIGFVSLSALAALIVIRRSYVSGWLASHAPIGGAVSDTPYRPVSEAVTPESVQRVAADVPKAESVVPVTIAAEREVAEPAAPPSAPAAEDARSAQEIPLGAPVARVEAATATQPARESRKTGKGSAAPAGRKTEGKSGKRKSGNKHAH